MTSKVQVGDLVKHNIRTGLDAGLVVSDSSLCSRVPKGHHRVYWFKYGKAACHNSEWLSKLTSS